MHAALFERDQTRCAAAAEHVYSDKEVTTDELNLDIKVKRSRDMRSVKRSQLCFYRASTALYELFLFVLHILVLYDFVFIYLLIHSLFTLL